MRWRQGTTRCQRRNVDSSCLKTGNGYSMSPTWTMTGRSAVTGSRRRSGYSKKSTSEKCNSSELDEERHIHDVRPQERIAYHKDGSIPSRQLRAGSTGSWLDSTWSSAAKHGNQWLNLVGQNSSAWEGGRKTAKDFQGVGNLPGSLFQLIRATQHSKSKQMQ